MMTEVDSRVIFRRFGSGFDRKFEFKLQIQPKNPSLGLIRHIF